MSSSHTVTLIEGDGVGPEVVAATCRLLKAAGVHIHWEKCVGGEKAFRQGCTLGVPLETIDSLFRTKIALKGPLQTPIGFGEKSANVALRQLCQTFASVRPVYSIPGIEGPFQDRAIDFVIVRENLEGLYSGIEYQETASLTSALALISREGSEAIHRYAFDLALLQNRSSVHAVTKANILKITQGLFKRTFEELAPHYPTITPLHLLVDNCAHQLVRCPEQFEVIVTTNLFGDILSDLASGLIGGLGFSSSANVGEHSTIFEAVHGSAPQIAGKNVVNPSGLILSAVMMLRYLEEETAANAIENALFLTCGKDRYLTQDGILASSSLVPVSTEAFTNRVIDNLGKPCEFARPPRPLPIPTFDPSLKNFPDGHCIGVDIFLEAAPQGLQTHLQELVSPTSFTLEFIARKGFSLEHTPFLPSEKDSLQCRFKANDPEKGVNPSDITALLKLVESFYPWHHIQKLSRF